MIKYHNEFNSSHNTIYFIAGSLYFGLIYSWWGNFTNLLGEPIYEEGGIFTNPWIMIFSFPYLFYGSILLFRSFKKYFMVYLKSKSFESKKFGLFLSFLLIITDIIYLSWFYTVDNEDSWDILIPNLKGVDIFNILLLLYASILVIRYGFFGNLSTVPIVNSRTVAARTNRATSTSNTVREQPSESTVAPIQERSMSAPPRRIQHTQREQAHVVVQPAVPIGSYEQRRQHGSQKNASKSGNQSQKLDNSKIRQYKPKGTILTSEDFKCIFCFQLPKTPEDDSRGVILCPNCKHPAHADEFRDWTRSSNLCSRCDAIIPESYRKNPEVIPTKRYLFIMKSFYSKSK
jgi:hypothetical protein